MIFATVIGGESVVAQFIQHPGVARVRRPLIATVQRVTAEHFGFDPNLMKSKCREHDIAHARQIAMFLTRELTHHSLPQIGRFFGKRDHTTVIHAIRAVENRICNSVEIAEHVEAIRERLVA